MYLRHPRIMQSTSLPQPSPEDLQVIVVRSSGPFIFVSTLVEFALDGKAPRQKLKSVLSLHPILDPLYDMSSSEVLTRSHAYKVPCGNSSA